MKKYGVVAFLLIHSFLSLPQSAASVKSFTIDDDKQALLALKNNLDHDAPLLTSWNESNSYCTWGGVSCCHRHQQRVCALNLFSSGLVGSISPSIGNLSFLKKLDLRANELYGAIPLTIGHLSRLQILDLRNNSLSGTFPTTLYNCSNIVLLGLSYNHFYGTLPSWLGHFKRMKLLVLGFNNFTGNIPLSIANISSLQVMDLLNNSLGGTIPNGIGQMSELHLVYLGGNNLSGIIPKSIFNLTNLSILNLALNKFQGHLHKNMGTNLLNIQELALSYNQLTGEIPSSLSNASTIQFIDFGHNKLSGIIPEEIGKHCPSFDVFSNELEAKDSAGWKFIEFFANCSSLKIFELGRNKLGGLLPSCIANFTSKLQYLDLEENYISGEVPSGIENLAGLSVLSLANNYLTGIIPVGIGKLQNLQQLYLGGNNFSGHIPSSIGNLTVLSVFSASGNRLVGAIPSSIGNLTQLTLLHLYNNTLTGLLPKSMFTISALSAGLELSNNFFSGIIPEEVRNLVNLVQLGLSQNNLSGELPEGLGNCQILTALSLDDNSFQGTIPSFLGKLKGLQHLNLSNNELFGPIPEELALVNDLSELYLAKNNLSGKIPLALENLSYLYAFDISYNNLEGPVPEKGVFSNVSALMLVGNSRLCGGIPELHLPQCLNRHDVKHLPMLLKIFFPIVSIILLLAFLLLAFFVLSREKNILRKSIESPILEDLYPKVSYGELSDATESFASSKLIGAGKYGRVYNGILQFKGEADSNKETHVVAIKVFDLQQLGSSKIFLAECEALRVIRHRNLLRIRTCCSTIDFKGNEFKALVFDYESNGNLHKWLHSEIDEGGSLSPLSLIQRLNIAIDIADALRYLHHGCQPSVIHCDLKPSNILLSEDLSARVADFGLAKLLPDPISKSLVESESSIGIRGSIGYVPPEYGEGGSVSVAGDVYSFGVLLLEMFTGRNPTEYMFKDGITLHTFVDMAFPTRVMDIVDPNLIVVNASENNAVSHMTDSLSCILKIGLICSNHSPAERMSMEDVRTQMHNIRSVYLHN